MATHTGAATKSLLDIPMTSAPSLETDLQRGRKRRRELSNMSTDRTTSPFGESAAFRGRCRYRSSSRYIDMLSLSRPTSQPQLLIGDCRFRNKSVSPSPSRRKMIRILQSVENRQRNQPPSRPRSPYASCKELEATQDLFRRRRQRTQSRSRVHSHIPASFSMSLLSGDNNITTKAVAPPLTAYIMAKSSRLLAPE